MKKHKVMLPQTSPNSKQLSRHRATIYPSGDTVLSVVTERKAKPEKKDKPDPDQDFPNMGLSDAAIRQKFPDAISPRHQKGQLGITPKGKRMLRSSAAIIARTVDRRFTTFMTVTTPAITEEENFIVNQSWGKVRKLLVQWISYQLEKNGINPDIAYSIEIQPGRYETSGIVGLHLHLVFQGRVGYGHDWVISPEALDAEWKRIFSRLLGREVDVSTSNKVETPRGDLRKEIGKYLSKGGHLVLDIIPDELLPDSWWGMTAKLRKKILAAIIRFIDDTATFLWENADDLPIKYRLVCLSEMYGNYPIAKVGWITDKIFLDQLTGLV